MIVCVAEKPSVGKEIAKVLGASKSRDGYMEGNGYQVTWTFGHLCCLKAPEDYDRNWKRWTLKDLPLVPSRFGIKLIDDNGIKKQFNTIKKLYSGASEIINCGDAGQEGELIQRWVMQLAGVRCPVKRLWISSLTTEAIRDGFRHLKPQSQYDSLYQAGLARACSDWLLGMSASRLYTLSYPQGRKGEKGRVLSIGRVQTPTLAMIVGRDYEIENFRPKPYWVLSTRYRNVVFASDKGKMEDQTRANIFANSIKGHPFTVVSVEKKEENELPPQLYDLTSLQVECNKKFGLSAQQSLTIIQSLYEKKVSTYPRVDTKYLTDDIYPKVPQILNGVSQAKIMSQQKYLPLVQQLAASGKKLPKSKKVFDNSKVTDHHAIIPTGVPPTGLTDMEANVYDLIAKRFISVFYPDCKFSTTTVIGEVVNEDGDKPEKIEFKVSGKEILEPGWREVYAKDVKANDEEDSQDGNTGGDAGNGANKKENVEERTLPSFVKGESGDHTPTLTEKWTTPPKYYTEATLLRAMETAGKFVEDEELRAALKENGIGRPSSRAGIIETLFKRHYIRRQRKNLMATPTGIELIDTIHEELLKSCELTGIWEKKLRDIEHKTYDPGQFINELKEQINQIVNDVLADNSSRITTTTEEDLKKKETKKKKTAPKPKKLPADDSIIGKVCPVCGQGTIIKGKTAYGCSNWKGGCKFRLPFAE